MSNDQAPTLVIGAWPFIGHCDLGHWSLLRELSFSADPIRPRIHAIPIAVQRVRGALRFFRVHSAHRDDHILAHAMVAEILLLIGGELEVLLRAFEPADL